MSLWGPVLAQSGLLNFSGEGYWFHRLLKLVPGFSLEGVTFVSKTTTWPPRKGNMPLDGEAPKELLPRCIWADPVQGITLNAVGLSGPGAEAVIPMIADREEPFWVSFMAVGQDLASRLIEAHFFTELLREHMLYKRIDWGIQLNLSCPNQKQVSQKDSIEEAFGALALMQGLGRPVMVKVSATTKPEQVVELVKSDICSGVCVGNTVPFGALPEHIDWCRLFGIPAKLPEMSPLYKKVGAPGGLSGPPLLPLTEAWVQQARELGITKHINAGGGVFSREDVRRLKEAGASSISIGTVALHRPWRVRGIIEEAHKLWL